jgi:hypothetical protein
MLLAGHAGPHVFTPDSEIAVVFGEAGELTCDEVQERFLQQVRVSVQYWQHLPDKTVGERLEGLAFSIMAILDGVSSLPVFIVAPLPHPDDKEFHRDEGEHWWPENHTVAVVCDISGGLHELLQGGE